MKLYNYQIGGYKTSSEDSDKIIFEIDMPKSKRHLGYYIGYNLSSGAEHDLNLIMSNKEFFNEFLDTIISLVIDEIKHTKALRRDIEKMKSLELEILKTPNINMYTVAANFVFMNTGNLAVLSKYVPDLFNELMSLEKDINGIHFEDEFLNIGRRNHNGVSVFEIYIKMIDTMLNEVYPIDQYIRLGVNSDEKR